MSEAPIAEAKPPVITSGKGGHFFVDVEQHQIAGNTMVKLKISLTREGLEVRQILGDGKPVKHTFDFGKIFDAAAGQKNLF